MGAPFMDYLIADGTVVPRAHQADYMEKIVYLPGSFMPFDSSYAIADRTFSREELGLPNAGFVFCCFNNSHKITPEVFDQWMRILGRVEDGVLWLSQANTEMCENLRKEAARRGVDGRRLIFASRMPSLPEHLARLRAADLFLDTFPYNAHATALDALWAGVPLLTYAGLGASPAASPPACCARSGDPSSSPAPCGSTRRRLASWPRTQCASVNCAERLHRRGRRCSIPSAIREILEAAFRTIYDRYHSGERPAHINDHLAV